MEPREIKKIDLDRAEIMLTHEANPLLGPITVVAKDPSVDEYAHLPLVVYKNGQRIVIGQAVLSGSEILATVEDAGLAEEIMEHVFRTSELSLGPIGIPRPRKKNLPGNPRARFDTPRNIEPKGIYGQRGK